MISSIKSDQSSSSVEEDSSMEGDCEFIGSSNDEEPSFISSVSPSQTADNSAKDGENDEQHIYTPQIDNDS